LRIGTTETIGVFDSWRDTLFAFVVEMSKVMRDLRIEDGANCLESRLRQLWQCLVSEATGGRDALARQADIFQNV
jgi:hypothetical protein